jgi:GDP-L-fucose synthase
MSEFGKIYLAGHAGLLGKSVYQEFISENYEVVTRNSSDLDLRIEKDVSDFIEYIRPDGVIFCAARAGGIGYNVQDPLEMFHQNSQIQYALFKVAQKLKIRKLIFISSAAVYPSNKNLNIEEDIFSGAPSLEHMQYALAKLSGMEMVRLVRERNSLDWVSLITTNIYGENDKWDKNRGHVIPALIMKILEAKSTNSPEVLVWGSGEASREFLHAKDAGKAIFKVYQSISNSKYDRYNLGGGIEVSIGELAKKISELCNYEGKLIFDSSQPEGPKARSLDINRLKHFIDWQPEILLQDGLKLSINSFLKFSSQK